jgi:hypothetical protein
MKDCITWQSLWRRVPLNHLASQAQKAAFTTREEGTGTHGSRGPAIEMPSTIVVKRSQSAACAQ